MAGLVQALHTLGLLGRAGSGESDLVEFNADDGQAIPVRVIGAGPPVVLVHGLGCSHRHWMPVARRLSARHSVYAWDARGHGTCRSQPGSAITLARLARDLQQMLDHFGLGRSVLVGHSMGALAVMQYLQSHGGERVAGVVLVDQSPRIVTDEGWRLGMFGGCSKEMLMGLISGARENLAETVIHAVEAATGDWVRRRLAPEATLGRALRGWLSSIDPSALLDLAESLVLGGQSPHYADVPLARYYQRAVRHATVTVFERSGHSPHVAEPGRFARELLQFLDDHA